MRKNITETPKKNRQSRSQLSGNLTVGIDLGDRSSRYCILNQEGEVVAASAVATTKKDLSRVFGTLRPSRLALEVGTHSPWVSRHLKAMEIGRASCRERVS